MKCITSMTCLLPSLFLIMKLVLNRVFFFKKKTAYEVRISDWSSDVCSSDLIALKLEALTPQLQTLEPREPAAAEIRKLIGEELIGRASCRERVCQSV